ncbi:MULTISPECIES: DUF2752 domain-containing protein [Stenotrophomonas]|uniref:DUF2752 domain-containing protein n=1 Tax=Stenotrophomonas TaxID=40323 RepID=UPI0015A42AA9|nr:DUF2752 domain-containing protein [Stenotrophomonas sp. SAM-B]NWF31686.1 DUF2752 domain-containing protein [Stenotrophomonas sp. SAM-B]
MPALHGKRWLLALLPPAAVAAGAGFWVLRHYDPNSASSPFPPCSFLAVTGYYCIGCGLTRALHALAHGDVVTAFSMNPLAMLMLAIAPLVIGWALGWRPRALQPLITLLMKPAFWLILLPAYWIARNLPWVPFTWLAPG